MHGTTAHQIMAPKITIHNERNNFPKYYVKCASVMLLKVLRISTIPDTEESP